MGQSFGLPIKTIKTFGSPIDHSIVCPYINTWALQHTTRENELKKK
jgi:hypothetical protein